MRPVAWWAIVTLCVAGSCAEKVCPTQECLIAGVLGGFSDDPCGVGCIGTFSCNHTAGYEGSPETKTCKHDGTWSAGDYDVDGCFTCYVPIAVGPDPDETWYWYKNGDMRVHSRAAELSRFYVIIPVLLCGSVAALDLLCWLVVS